MTCDETRLELVAYHFGEVTDEERAAVEAHLLGCPACLGDLFDLKRAVEAAGRDDRPSARMRVALRDAVARQVAPETVPWSWWERPVALACAAVTVLAALSVLHGVSSGSGTMPRSLDEAPTMIERGKSPH